MYGTIQEITIQCFQEYERYNKEKLILDHSWLDEPCQPDENTNKEKNTLEKDCNEQPKIIISVCHRGQPDCTSTPTSQ